MPKEHVGWQTQTERLCFNKILKMKFKDLQLQKHDAKEKSYWKESSKKLLINRKKIKATFLELLYPECQILVIQAQLLVVNVTVT